MQRSGLLRSSGDVTGNHSIPTNSAISHYEPDSSGKQPRSFHQAGKRLLLLLTRQPHLLQLIARTNYQR